jgi:hypothetical protein
MMSFVLLAYIYINDTRAAASPYLPRRKKLIPTINDFGHSYSEYTDDQKKQEILEKYFREVQVKLLNKESIEMERTFFEVADIVCKVFLSYVYVDCDVTIKTVYESMRPSWEKYGVSFAKNHFSGLLKNVYIKGRCVDINKIVILSTVIDAAFNHDEVYELTVARMAVNKRTDLIKAMGEMRNIYKMQAEDKETLYRYMKPRIKKEPEVPERYYRRGNMKNLLQKGYDGATYKWEDDEDIL